jgi:hypothetical protein
VAVLTNLTVNAHVAHLITEGVLPRDCAGDIEVKISRALEIARAPHDEAVAQVDVGAALDDGDA